MTARQGSFTVGQIADIRRLRRSGAFVASMLGFFPRHTRDEVIEAIDAIRRYPHNGEACDHVNFILAGQGAGVPFINGIEAWKVTRDHGRVSYAAQF